MDDGGLAVHGCVSRPTPLASGLGVRGVVECTVSGRAPRSLGEARSFLEQVVDYASGLVEGLSSAGRLAWEGLGGGRYRVYSIPVSTPWGLGEARLVSAEWLGEPLVALVALPGEPRQGRIGEPIEDARLPGWAPVEDKAWPRGQKPVPRFISYMAEEAPGSHPAMVKIEWLGAVKTIGLEDLLEMAEWRSLDFHCVTGWSVSSRKWLVVSLEELLPGAPRGCWAAAGSVSGYTAVMPCVELRRGYLALGLDNEALDTERGGPVRLLVPSLYGWKSVKWVSWLRSLEGYSDGFWEALGYHERGSWRLEERFKIRNPGLDGGTLKT